jgi:hypothetical protein
MRQKKKKKQLILCLIVEQQMRFRAFSGTTQKEI